MCLLRRTLASVLIGGCILLACGGMALAQGDVRATSGDDYDWSQRVLKRRQAAGSETFPVSSFEGASRPWSPNRTARGVVWTTGTQPVEGEVVGAPSRRGPTFAPQAIAEPGYEVELEPTPMQETTEMSPMEESPFGGSCYGDPTCGSQCGDGQCYGSPCYDAYGYQGCDDGWCVDYYDPCWGLCGWLRTRPWGEWLQDFSFFAGMHGFKGPVDRGGNGNFGFHEGMNFGAPLGGPLGLGYQLGIEGVHSNFSGDNTVDALLRRGDRDQIFVTGGLFHRRPCGGLQWGVVYDLLYDAYYVKATLGQVRTEINWMTHRNREYGFWGAFGTRNDEVVTLENDQLITRVEQVTNLFAFYSRRHFSGGGEGRLWSGFTGKRDVLLGGDIRVPLGTSWALENDFHYLLPKEGRGENGFRQETWSVNINLVWYPGRASRCIAQDPYRPFLNVANNSVFMVDLKPTH